jgi:glycosyltransferase involved in cell wall biosynthesis
MKIMIIGGISESLINFRGCLIQTMLDQGHEVLACAGEPREHVAATLASWGAQYFPVKLARAGMSPTGDLRTFWQLWHLMRKHQPDIVLSYTIKPVIWGGFSARLAGVPRIFSLVTGLGYVFIQDEAGTETGQKQPRSSPLAAMKKRVVGAVARRLYRMSLKSSEKVIFQNPDDRHEFVAMRLVDQEKCVVVNGSGIDTEYFGLAPLPQEPVFLLIGRLLLDKGIREYVSAMETVQSERPNSRAILVGSRDPNPASVSAEELEQWQSSGVVDYRGELKDVRPAIADCSVYVLPSYREGTPRTVLEAMSMGRPIITTDAPGCRETVKAYNAKRVAVTPDGEQPTTAGSQSAATDDVEPSSAPSSKPQFERRGRLKIGANGILVPPRDADSLAEAIRFFLDNPDQIARMGEESRRYAEERYDVHQVNAVILGDILKCSPAGSP